MKWTKFLFIKYIYHPIMTWLRDHRLISKKRYVRTLLWIIDFTSKYEEKIEAESEE